jgi:TolB-like protein
MIGTTVSHYRIVEEIGRGGMGVVYKAVDTRLDRTVALKLIPPGARRSKEEKARFSHEAKAAASLSHPNVATIYEFGEWTDTATGLTADFIAMEFVDGIAVAQRIEQGALSVEAAVDIALQVARALAKAHEKGIVHRDIKSDNVMLTADGVVKVLDFGLASIAGQTRVTKEGTTVGTIAYMSPEQSRGEAVDHRTDLWSLGVLLYEMLAGKRPFTASYEQALVYQILNENPAPVASVRNDIPPALDGILRKLLQKNPDLRLASATDLVNELSLLVGHQGSSSRLAAAEAESAHRSIRTRRSGIIAAAVAVPLLVIAGYVLLSKPTASDIRSLAVLPFENLSHDPEQEYFADEMTDQLITELSKVQSLRVISRRSAMTFKNRHELIPAIGKTLNVEALITATVFRSGDRVRVNAQLVRATDEASLWSESYDEKLEGVLDLQATLARSITRRISAALTPDEQARLAKTHSVNPEAFDLVARGNYLMNVSADKEGFGKAHDLMRRAVGLDSTFVEAQVGLAMSIVFTAFWGFDVSDKMFGEAVHALEIAERLDPGSARALSARGQLAWARGDVNECIRANLKAAELDPRDGFIATNESWMLMVQGRYEEGLRAAQRAVELDPLSQYARCNLMGWYYAQRRNQDAETEAHRILEIDSTWEPALWQLGVIAEREGRMQEARSWWMKDMKRLNLDTKDISDDLSWENFRLKRDDAYRRGGPVENNVWLKLIEGKNEQALNLLLDISHLTRKSAIFLCLFYRDFDPLRADPRFVALVENIQLPVEAYCILPKAPPN